MLPLTQRLTDLTVEQIQRWVVSLLVLAVSSFPIGAMAATAIVLDQDGAHDQALLLIAGMALLGCVAIGIVRRIHERSPLTPWLLLGLAPAVMTALFVV